MRPTSWSNRCQATTGPCRDKYVEASSELGIALLTITHSRRTVGYLSPCPTPPDLILVLSRRLLPL